MQEILTFDYHYKRLTIKALNKTYTIGQAAILLGVERHTVVRWIEKFDIKFNTQTNIYYGEVIQRARVAEEI